MHTRTFLTTALFISLSTLSGFSEQPIRMANQPDLSPDGSQIIFSWHGDIWKASAQGGQAERLTSHPARDFTPQFTPDGKSICFSSTREGKQQVFIMPSDGGTARQLTFHSEGALLQDVAPDGKSILTECIRDHKGARPYRLIKVGIDEQSSEELIFDAQARNGRYSSDGKSIIFTREGVQRYRKGYHGTQASQTWTRNSDDGTFDQPITSEYGCRTPFFVPDSKDFYYTQGGDNGFNLWHFNHQTKETSQITNFKDDSVMDLSIANNGSQLAFRHLFDLYTLPLNAADAKPLKLKLWHKEDLGEDDSNDLIVKQTKDASFSPSGLEMVFVAEGDLWAMDTLLKKPNRLTKTLGHESDVWFSHNGKSIYYLYNDGIKTEIRKLEKPKPNKYWWETEKTTHKVIIKASERPLSITPGPKDKKIAYTAYPGDLWVAKPDGSEAKRLLESWDEPYAAWSPDGKWLAYSVKDNDFNSDIHIIPADASSAPVNISRHPDNDYMPAWSPDGRRLAFMGRHHKENYDIFYVDLYRADEAKDKDGEMREKARKLMKKDPAYKSTAKKVVEKAMDTITKGQEKEKKKKETYDLDNISKRIKKIEIKGITPNKIIWHSDSKRILYQTTGGKTTYAIEAKSGAKPAKFADATGTPIRMDAKGKGKLYWTSDGVPAVLSDGKNIKYPFTIHTQRDSENWKRMMFRFAWGAMRDNFYDPSMNNRDWDKVLEKYEDMASQAPSSVVFDRLASMMLGELNASHTGFRSKTWPTPWKPKSLWKEDTAHLGVRFDPTHQGRGWKAASIIPNSPASRSTSQIKEGEIILKVGDQEVSSDTPIASVLNRRLSDPLWLTVSDEKNKERQVKIQPISYSGARALVKAERIDDTEAMVDKLSAGELGYIHVARMMWDEFEKFEHHLYEQGAGKKGIVIDVRDNGGGFTTDHLLTALCQPQHAFTVPRNGSAGYPHDRIVYATWNKPIIVLCNQNSFSNAEIFAHAIRNLDRGKLVGINTAGGVISTGSVNIMGASMRMPFRGWFDIKTGQDMELNGAAPDFVLWNKPGELTAGNDRQLEKAVSVLLEETTQAKKTPKSIYRSSEKRNTSN